MRRQINVCSHSKQLRVTRRKNMKMSARDVCDAPVAGRQLHERLEYPELALNPPKAIKHRYYKGAKASSNNRIT